ncbi:MAG TPA: dephospho-CoA kinase [Terriglobales bacterium]|nr:dephospho-CoA kinase [Terriglobales bacterium]
MLKVGLTGGIACGKSTVAAMLAVRGANTLQADLVAHELTRPGQAVYDEIIRRFGREILNQNKTINRVRLAEVVFSPERPRIDELNEIVHPAVLAYQQQWLEDAARREPKSVAVVEAALILEAGAHNQFDKIVVVTCSPHQKAERLSQRMGIPLAEAEAEVVRRSAAQWQDEEKLRYADYVIDSSGTLADTEAQVEKLWCELSAMASLR